MRREIKYPYLLSIIASIFLYWIPYEIGGNIIRWILGFITISLFIYTLRSVFKYNTKENRVNIALWQTNALALLHLGLIYISLTFQSLIALILSILLSVILYYVVDYKVKQIIYN